MLDVVDPATMLMEPPTFVEPLPTVMLIRPPGPLLFNALPVPIEMLPDAPELAVPELNTRAPLMPVEAESIVLMVIPPLVEPEPVPDAIVT